MWSEYSPFQVKMPPKIIFNLFCRAFCLLSRMVVCFSVSSSVQSNHCPVNWSCDTVCHIHLRVNVKKWFHDILVTHSNIDRMVNSSHCCITFILNHQMPDEWDIHNNSQLLIINRGNFLEKSLRFTLTFPTAAPPSLDCEWAMWVLNTPCVAGTWLSRGHQQVSR